MKRKNSSYILALVCFVLLAALCVAGANFVLTPKWSIEYRSGSNIRGFYDMPENSVDVLFLGPSQIVCGLNPNLMYEDYGISAYCCGTEAQPVLGSYYWLQEALKTQDIQAVVMVMTDLFEDNVEVNYRKALDYMKFSSLKWEALQTYKEINPDMNFLSYLLPLVQYHSRYNELTQEDFNGDQTNANRGFLISTNKRGMDFAGVSPTEDTLPQAIQEVNLEYFQKICALCRENNITLVLMMTPDMSWTAEKSVAVQTLAEENNLAFYDFNIVSQWSDWDYANAMADFRHLNSYGAEYTTPIITQELLNTCNLPDRRGDSFMEQLDSLYQADWAAAVTAAEQGTAVGP